jgi:hypothetical protein
MQLEFVDKYVLMLQEIQFRATIPDSILFDVINSVRTIFEEADTPVKDSNMTEIPEVHYHSGPDDVGPRKREIL